MTQSDAAAPVDPAPVDPAPVAGKRWRGRIAWWAEQLIPRVVGLMFLWAGMGKMWNPASTHRVFAFDGVPQPLIEPLTHIVWIAEVILALLLLSGIARRRAVMATIFVLLVYSLQLAYLIAANNPPEDCGCALMEKYGSAKQGMVLGLARNAVMAACLEWVRLRMAGRALPLAAAGGAKSEDG